LYNDTKGRIAQVLSQFAVQVVCFKLILLSRYKMVWPLLVELFIYR